MGQSAAQVKSAISARLDAEPEKRAKHLARDETWASRDHLAVVNGAPLRQRVLDSPRHPDRVVVLDMFWHRGLASPRNRLAQARHSHPRSEPGAESNFLDKLQRALLASHAPRSNPPEVMVAMTLQRVDYVGHPEIRSTHSAKIQRQSVFSPSPRAN